MNGLMDDKSLNTRYFTRFERVTKVTRTEHGIRINQALLDGGKGPPAAGQAYDPAPAGISLRAGAHIRARQITPTGADAWKPIA